MHDKAESYQCSSSDSRFTFLPAMLERLFFLMDCYPNCPRQKTLLMNLSMNFTLLSDFMNI